MNEDVGAAYDAMVEPFLAVNLEALDRVPTDREPLAAFAERAAAFAGVVADLGCGPGHIAHHLTEFGLDVVGYDLSPGLLAEARRRYPHVPVHIGDMAALDVADAALAGIVARYSLIHTPPANYAGVFAEWSRVLAPGAPLLVSFFAAASVASHGSPFDHAVVTAYELFPAIVEEQLGDAGFGGFQTTMRAPFPGERPLDHATILASAPSR